MCRAERDGLIHDHHGDHVLQANIRNLAVVNNREIPDICLQHMVAVMIVDKTVTFRSAHETARMKDPAVLRERAKVQLIPDEELEKRMPQREAIVDLVLANGTRLTEHVEAVR